MLIHELLKESENLGKSIDFKRSKEIVKSAANKKEMEEFIKESKAQIVDSVRVIINNRKLENTLGIDPNILENNVDVYEVDVYNSEKFGRYPKYFVVPKGKKIKQVVAIYDLQKPAISIHTNRSAVINYISDSDSKYCDQVYGIIKKIDNSELRTTKTRHIAVFLDKEVLSSVTANTDEDKDKELDPKTEGIFVIGKWGNPYNSNDEYTWSGPYSSKKAASAAMSRILKRGPKTFVDWSGTQSKYFTGLEAFRKAATKVGINPKIDEDDLYFRDL